MQKSDLLSLYDAQMRISLQLPGVAFERSAYTKNKPIAFPVPVNSTHQSENITG